jgi:hypothetical protein
MRRLIPFVAAAWIAASPVPAGAAGTTVPAQPVSRPLAVVQGAVARSKVADPVPAPTQFVLTGQLAADGRVAIQCDAAENPAWRAWRDRVDAGRRTEAR